MAAFPTDDVEWLLQAIEKAVSAGVKEALSQLQIIQPGQPGQPLRVFLPGQQTSSQQPKAQQHHQQQQQHQQQAHHHHQYNQHHLLPGGSPPNQEHQPTSSASQSGGAVAITATTVNNSNNNTSNSSTGTVLSSNGDTSRGNGAVGVSVSSITSLQHHHQQFHVASTSPTSVAAVVPTCSSLSSSTSPSLSSSSTTCVVAAGNTTVLNSTPPQQHHLIRPQQQPPQQQIPHHQPQTASVRVPSLTPQLQHLQPPPAHHSAVPSSRDYDVYGGGSLLVPHTGYVSGSACAVSSVGATQGLVSAASPSSVCSDGSPPPLQIEMDQPGRNPELQVPSTHPYLVKPRRRSRWVLSDHSPMATRICVLDIVCLLPSTSTWIPIPRGDTRKMLADNGLIKKLQITSTSTEDELKSMISNLFCFAFNLAEDELLPFDYLRTQPSCRRLVRPEVTDDWHWGGREVANLAGQGCLYIVSKIPLSVDSKAPLKSIVQEVQRQTAAAAVATTSAVVNPATNSTSVSSAMSLSGDSQQQALPQPQAPPSLPASLQTHALTPMTDSRTRMRICTKEIVCLLPTCITSIPIPRRYTRRILAEKGLVQKIRIATYWTEEQIKKEISMLFRKPYGLQQGEILPFDYLCTKPNCKRLVRASASDSVQWGGQEVARLAGQGCLYIVSRIPLYTNTMISWTGCNNNQQT